MREPGGPSTGGRPPRQVPARGERRASRPDSLSGLLLEGRYRIGPRLARGGMSTVYRGVDLRLDRPVAIKVMSPQYAADPTFLTRFEREARAAARLDNPRVVGVYDQGRDGDIVFLVMELVDGGTLRDLLHQRGELSVPVALSVLEPLLDALAAAHAAGLVHRDVKPENVLISARGEVKVADFGLVRAVTSTTMATGNVILGTVAYLSPEQVATGAADERSDVYSAGIVAYEMLTGHPPFAGDNALSVAYQHVHSDVPPVADEAPGVPVDIAAAVDAATNRDPLARPANAAEFLRRLRAARRELALALVPVPVPRPPARRAEPGTSRSGGADPRPVPGSSGGSGAEASPALGGPGGDES
ncbi:MAG TPA: protein kinase, partial [Nakamurella sp.]|nr:protein kinase [Nakamurella sp.]